MFRLLYLRDAAAGSAGYSQSFRLSKQDPLFGGRRVEAFSRAAAREGARSVWRFLRDGEDPSTQDINARKVVRGEVRSRSSRETKEDEFRLWRDGEEGVSKATGTRWMRGAASALGEGYKEGKEE